MRKDAQKFANNYLCKNYPNFDRKYGHFVRDNPRLHYKINNLKFLNSLRTTI